MPLDLPPLLDAVLLGLLCGFVTSMPGGPVNVTLVNEGARRGLSWALFIGLGAVVMEAIYCTLAFAGFAQLFESKTIRAAMELTSFILMLWLGLRYLRGTPIPGEARGIELVEHRFHPHTAFWTGFARVLGNPGVLLLWITVAATLLSHEWLENRWPCKWAFVGGVAGGGAAWFGALSWGVSKGHRHFGPSVLRRMSQYSGILLLATAAVIGVRIILLLRRNH